MTLINTKRALGVRAIGRVPTYTVGYQYAVYATHFLTKIHTRTVVQLLEPKDKHGGIPRALVLPALTTAKKNQRINVRLNTTKKRVIHTLRATAA